MTVPVQTTFTVSVANGLTTSFPYSFKITDEEDIKVFFDNVLQTTGFTITGIGEEIGGNIEFAVAPSNGVVVLRALSPVFKRVIDYQQFGDWLAEVVNKDFDRLWLALQSIEQNFTRSLKLPVDTDDDQVVTQNATQRAGKLLSFDDDGNISVAVPADVDLTVVSEFIAQLLNDVDASQARATLDAQQTISLAQSRISGRKTAGTGAVESLTLSDVLDMIGSAAEGDILYRGASTWSRLEKGTALQRLRMNSAANAPEWGGGDITFSTVVTTTGGTAIDFTSIPSGVKRITIMFGTESGSGTSIPIIQIGTSGGIDNSGYSGSAAYVAAGNTSSCVAQTIGFGLDAASAAASTRSGAVVLTNITGNTWVLSGAMTRTDSATALIISGVKTLSGMLDRVRITHVNGTDTFDAVSINVAWE